MSNIQAEMISGLQAKAQPQAEGYTPEWLALLSWDLLFVDGEIDRYRVQVQGCYRQWLVFRSSLRQVEGSRRRIEHEYALAPRLEPSWALVPQALLQTAEGPLWVCDDPGGQALHELADGKISIDRFLRLALGAARAVGQAHGNGLLHRDIKPSNLLQDAEGTVRLTGFGVSVETGSGIPTNTDDSICGTLAYMPPEQAGRVGQQADQRSDLYALGMTFYELLTGRLPFEASDAVEWVYCHVARQPLSPRQFRDSIPVPMAQMILQLIAKNPDDRYQTACSLEADLRSCLTQWSQFQHLSAFEPADSDRRCRGSEPQFLLTRPVEYQALHAAFNRVAESGLSELVLLSGQAGAGKSTLVRQLHQGLASSQMLFASGKFDQTAHNSPYASLAQALRSLIMRVLGETAEELQRWRNRLSLAVAGHGRLIANLVPEIEFILGPQAGPELPANETKHLFHYVLQRFLNSFVSPERPLVLFFDDLQWLDDATLSFISGFSDGQYRNILLVLAYRDSRAEDSALSGNFIGQLRRSPARLTEIHVAALDLEAVAQWVAMGLSADAALIRPLAELIHEKTDGNPFFVGQLLRTLLEEQLISFDRQSSQWGWDQALIRSHRHAENVIDLMVARIARLPLTTQKVLGQMACIGSSIDLKTLSQISQGEEHVLRADLAPAIEAGLVVEDHQGFAFYHDRVQESAYQLTPLAARPAEHARIARLLIADLEGRGRPDQVFRIAGHLQRIHLQLLDCAEQRLFCGLLIQAAQQAMESAAVQSAFGYLVDARSLLLDEPWHKDPELSRELGFTQAQCLILDGQFGRAGQVIDELLTHVKSHVERAQIYALKVELQVLACRYQEAAQTAGEGLRLFGIHIPEQVDAREVEQRYRFLLEVLGSRSIDSLAELPEMRDRSYEAAMGLMASMIASASFIDDDLLFVLTCEMVLLSLEYGVCPASTHGLGWFGVALAHKYAAYGEGAAYARLARTLVQRHGYLSSESATLVALDQVCVWTQPLEQALGYARSAFASSYNAGNLTMSCYASLHIVFNQLFMGEYLERVEEEIDKGLDFAGHVRFKDVEAALLTVRGLIHAMRRGNFADSPRHDQAEQWVDSPDARNSAMTPVVFWSWLFEGIGKYMHRDFKGAALCLETAAGLAWSTPAHIHVFDLHFFSALNLAAGCRHDDAAGDVLDRMTPHLEKIDRWAELNPHNFKDKALLVRAEVARLQGDGLAAMTLYEESVTAAANGGFLHVQALAHELAGEFHHVCGLYTSARSHYRNARDCYQRWGALGKVAGLEARGGILRAQASLSRPSISISMGQESLDLVSVMKASQALSEEIVLDRLIGILLTNTIIHAGAQHALLLLIEDETPQVRARGQVHESGIATDLSVMTPSARHLPLSMLYTVIRTRQLVVLDNAMHPHVFATDEYFDEHQVRSVLCLPLIKQGQVVGALYLENNLAPGVFTSGRTAVLELLAGQAAISLENARLYAELTEENTRRRQIEVALRTSKATLALGQRISQSGSFRWDPGTDEAQWSDELFAVWGLPVAAVAPALPVLEKMIHPEDLQAFSSMLSRALRDSSAFEHTFRIIRPDGTLRHIELLGEPDGEQFFVGVVSDVTERKTTETALRTARAELGRVSQATTMGELAASIAHEINQPLASIVSNASASVRWLNRDVPVVQEALAGLGDIVNDGKRAAGIVRALQSLAKQTPLNREPLYITDVIQQVVLLTATEIEQRHVLLYKEVREPQLSVEGDAVQLQQVILNLIMNAVDAMSDLHDRPRRLAITCDTVADEYVVVSIQDNGYGIDPEHVERIFDAFFTTKEKGMGMGLAICRSIIEAHGGMLRAFSGRSSGAVFVFTLPVVVGR
ncbi:AAA family ATPase [Pseudomonas sp. Irchel 3A5]|uniref:ATP-binding sensor histidine kinase n=1 Tax=Pseudomonas sp. Irchel 3A5 TaxID=2008911 RepID=UPI000BA47205|nr:AAA family ATPase [Pseudomonas sp. Irchel 3A5]